MPRPSLAKAGALSIIVLVLALCLAASPVKAAVTFTVSPNVVSNAYNGLITLQINGLTNGVTNVVVQKFLDVNSNSVIDSGDLLVQQFRLSAGQLNIFTNEATSTPVTVTNFMPGDTSSTTNQMTIPLNFQNGDFAQTLVGQYLYKVSSSANTFTNPFVVTNSAFSCVVTGAVINDVNFTNIPRAIVLLCLNQSGPIVVQAGTVANTNGVFSLRAPPGNYVMVGARSNFVEDISQAGITLSAKGTTNGTFALTSATTNITGKVVNSGNSNGVGGVSGTMISTNELLSFYFTDTNGYFYAPITTNNFWEGPVDAFDAAFQGLLTPLTNQLLNVSNKTINITNTLAPANAIFYGVVSNSSAVPMPGVYVYADDNAGHQSIGMTDSRGKYVVDVSGGTNVWNLFVLFPDNPGLTNSAYVFAPGFLQTNMQPHQAVQQDFSFLIAPYSISGTVQDYNGNPVVGVEVFATNGVYEAANGVTASDGSYSINVSPGTWTVGIDSNSLAGAGFTNVPPNQTVTVSSSAVTGVNFLIEVCGEIEISTTNLPNAIVGEPYNAEIQAVSCGSVNNWAPAYGITLTSIHDKTNVFYPAGTPIFSDTRLIGTLGTSFSFGVNTGNPDYASFVNCTGSASVATADAFNFDNVSATVNLSGPIDSTTNITVNFPNVANGKQLWTATPTTQNGSNYTTTLTFGVYTNNPIAAGNTVAVNAGSELIFPQGTASNRIATIVGGFHSKTTPGISSIAATSAAFTNQDNSLVWIQWGTNMSEYFISADGPQSTNLPPGLHLYPDGSNTATIYGTPTGIGTNGGNFNISVMAEDSSSNVTVQPFSMFVFPTATLTGPSSGQAGMLESSNTFQMQLTGLTTNLNYTVLMTTNLESTNWLTIFTANNPVTNSIIVPDTSATDATRFYRLQISQ
ncbi:MAG TPA: carboxypeptidase-like regulatory domain-containing protein [Verrucomicrobiae bacterium]|nr:carboxypeptidase-like regulatory domain-containing protein [Verrucomicrobiae bacterium]